MQQSNGNGEVTIIALTDLVILPDLGVRLLRGARVNVPLSSAMRSRDLPKAKMDGIVTTQTLRSAAIRIQENVSSDTVTSQAPRAGAHDPNLILEALAVLTEEVRGLRRDLAHTVPPTLDFGPLLAQLQGMRGPTLNLTTPQTSLFVPSLDEVFIPSNLTGSGDITTNLKVSSESSVDQGVADAMAALKAARKKPKVV